VGAEVGIVQQKLILKFGDNNNRLKLTDSTTTTTTEVWRQQQTGSSEQLILVLLSTNPRSLLGVIFLTRHFLVGGGEVGGVCWAVASATCEVICAPTGSQSTIPNCSGSESSDCDAVVPLGLYICSTPSGSSTSSSSGCSGTVCEEVRSSLGIQFLVVFFRGFLFLLKKILKHLVH
jgi:hypothetical protein